MSGFNSWFDAVLIDNEAELQTYIRGLDQTARTNLINEIHRLLGPDISDATEYGELRVLLERARPFALSRILWARRASSSDPIEPIARAHLKMLGITENPKRLAKMGDLQERFTHRREKKYRAYMEPLLKRQNFKCAFCGMFYYNEELQARGTLTSPHNFRTKVKNDALKRHWKSLENRSPTVDHVWNVALYGANRLSNFEATCRSCNNGKSNFAFVAQSPPFLGLPDRDDMMGVNQPISDALFVAQIWREPRCSITGKSAVDTELTVRIKNPNLPVILDNLETIESPERP